MSRKRKIPHTEATGELRRKARLEHEQARRDKTTCKCLRCRYAAAGEPWPWADAFWE